MILQKEVKFALGLGVIFLLLAAALFVNKEEEPIDLTKGSGEKVGDTASVDTGGGTTEVPSNTQIPENTTAQLPENTSAGTPEDTSTKVITGDDFVRDDDVKVTPDETSDETDPFADYNDEATTTVAKVEPKIEEPKVETGGYTRESTTVLDPETTDRDEYNDTAEKVDTVGRTEPIDLDFDTPPKEKKPVYSGDGFEYTVQKDDMYGTLAKKFYGKTSDWRRIEKANPGVDPSELMPGMRIFIPGPVINKPDDTAVAAEDTALPLTGRKYKVKKEDTFGKISKRFYGTPAKWRDIMKANKIKDEFSLRAGSVIILPGIKEETEDEIAGLPNISDIPSPGDKPVGTIRKTHIVSKEETLWAIAEMYYGDGMRYKDVVKANPGMDKDNLKVGQKIIIPGLKGSVSPGSGEYFMYRIQPLDTLSEISSRFLGTSSRWREIQVLNGNLDPNKLPVGKEIRIPGKQSAVPVPPKRESGVSRTSTVPDVSFDGPGSPSYLGGPAGADSSTYVVQVRDNLGIISRKVYGSGEYWPQILKANPQIKNKDVLYVGMELNIPAIEGVKRRAYDPGKSYTSPSVPEPRVQVSEPPNRRKPSGRTGDSYLDSSGRRNYSLPIESTRF